VTPLDTLARAAVDAWSRGDGPAYRELTDDGYVYEEAATGRRVVGVDRVLDEWRALRSSYPDATVELLGVEVRGQTTLAQVAWRGTGCGGDRDGKRLELWDLVTTRWRDGRAVTERHHVGMLGLA
jgi:hypothetical protein